MNKRSRERLHHSILLILPAILLSACQWIVPARSSTLQTARLYQQLLNLPVPSEISQLEMDGDSMEAGLWTAVSFRYTAPPAYFDRLSAHREFAQPSDLNTPIAPISCTSSQMPASFSYWTDRQITLDGRQCYLGVYFPYIHYLIYDPQTQYVEHFVAGMSE